MKILLDTNILVHAYNKSSPHQGKAAGIIRQAMRSEIEACVTAQVLYEFFAVVTNAKRVQHPMPPDEATDICTDFWQCHEVEKINPSGAVPLEVFEHAKRLKLSKGGVFDCVLAVTARENGVEVIYTENVADFKDYGFFKAINPLLEKA